MSAPVVNETVESSDESDVEYSLSEAIESWLFNKAASTRTAYSMRINCFRAWLKSNYNRDIDHRLKRKHIRIYLNEKSKSCGQIRAVLVVLKSLCKELKKRNILKTDVSSGFESGKQKVPKFERNL